MVGYTVPVTIYGQNARLLSYGIRDMGCKALPQTAAMTKRKEKPAMSRGDFFFFLPHIFLLFCSFLFSFFSGNLYKS
jgi:hypothetical protein